MTGIQPYSQAYSFTAFQQAQGNDAFPGVQLDIELADIGQSLDSIGGFLQQAFRSDGQLTNGSVTLDALSSEIQIGISPPTVWASDTAYVPGNSVTFGLGLYAVAVAHTSSASFQLDLAAGLLSQVANFATYGLLAANSVGTQQLQGDSVTQDKLGPASVGSVQLQPNSVTRDKAAANFGVLPIGAEIDFAGIKAPVGWLFEVGQLLSRVTYAALLAVVTETTTAAAQNGSSTLTGVAEDLTPYGLIGAAIEGSGVPQGAFVGSVTANTIGMVTAAGAPAQATATVAASSITLFPHGNGDGATTFAIPDARGRVSAGRDDMGGAAAGRLTTQVSGRLGGTGGEQTHTLSVAELATHAHGTIEQPHTHGTTELPHTHTVGTNTQAVTVQDPNTGGSAVPLSSPTPWTTSGTVTGLTVNSASTGLTVNTTGSGAAHNNVQPTRIVNKIIFAGV